MPFESSVIVTIRQLMDKRHLRAVHRERYGLRSSLFDPEFEGWRSTTPGSGLAASRDAADGQSEDEQRDETVDQKRLPLVPRSEV